MQIKGVSSDSYIIAGQNYKPTGAIFYHGLSFDEVHYTCMVRKANKQMEANDANICKKNQPRNSKNMYLIILERIQKKF